MIDWLKEIVGNLFSKESIRDFAILGLILIAGWFLYGNDALNERIDAKVKDRLAESTYRQDRFRDSLNDVMEALLSTNKALEKKNGGGK